MTEYLYPRLQSSWSADGWMHPSLNLTFWQPSALSQGSSNYYSLGLSSQWLSTVTKPGTLHCSLLHIYKVIFSLCSAQSCPTVCEPDRPLCPWDSPGKNTGVSCHALLQGIFLIQGLNLHLLVSCIGRQVLYHQHHLESPLNSLKCFKFI